MEAGVGGSGELGNEVGVMRTVARMKGGIPFLKGRIREVRENTLLVRKDAYGMLFVA